MDLEVSTIGSITYYRTIPGSLVTDVINRHRREYAYFEKTIKPNYAAALYYWDT
jgi:hypothetical protein